MTKTFRCRSTADSRVWKTRTAKAYPVDRMKMARTAPAIVARPNGSRLIAVKIVDVKLKPGHGNHLDWWLTNSLMVNSWRTRRCAFTFRHRLVHLTNIPTGCRVEDLRCLGPRASKRRSSSSAPMHLYKGMPPEVHTVNAKGCPTPICEDVSMLMALTLKVFES